MGSNQYVRGNTTFFNLRKVATAADTLTFQVGSTQTVAGALTLRGSPGKLLALRSSAQGSTWNIVPGSVSLVSFVDVQDSTDPAATPVTATRSRNRGHNTGWKFA